MGPPNTDHTRIRGGAARLAARERLHVAARHTPDGVRVR
jgi:hypothetical protein